ncbi:hypothetical protein [Mycobacterium alsense]|uniref:hypothetical protein n=1 Tax=Mycobacterium alsense TaxID=324058 RepID=UPI001FD558C6|nr:hypothetical protein [Mycobacterium alsense]
MTVPNTCATAADTSSAAMDATFVVAGPAEAMASPSASPIPLRSADAATRASGAAIREVDILDPDIHEAARLESVNHNPPDPENVALYLAESAFKVAEGIPHLVAPAGRRPAR